MSEHPSLASLLLLTSSPTLTSIAAAPALVRWFCPPPFVGSVFLLYGPPPRATPLLLSVFSCCSIDTVGNYRPAVFKTLFRPACVTFPSAASLRSYFPSSHLLFLPYFGDFCFSSVCHVPVHLIIFFEGLCLFIMTEAALQSGCDCSLNPAAWV